MGSQSVGRDLATFTSLPMQGVPVQSLVREPGSHKPQGQKSKKHKTNDYGNKFNKVFKEKKLLGEGNGNPLQYSCLERGAWWATAHGVAKG